MSTVMELLPEGYGYVILTGIASSFVNFWMGMKVGMARKKYGVKYPAMYSTESDIFNCIQRAHQNTLENYPMYLLLLLVGGLGYPYICAIGGVVNYLGRIAYAQGYYTGDPSKRSRGFFGYFGLIAMLGCTGMFAARLNKFI